MYTGGTIQRSAGAPQGGGEPAGRFHIIVLFLQYNDPVIFLLISLMPTLACAMISSVVRAGVV